MDKKITISRSYTRKINLGNYESEDFFCSRSVEVPVDTSYEEQENISKSIFLQCIRDVGNDVTMLYEMRQENDGKVSPKKLDEMLKTDASLCCLILKRSNILFCEILKLLTKFLS